MLVVTACTVLFCLYSPILGLEISFSFIEIPHKVAKFRLSPCIKIILLGIKVILATYTYKSNKINSNKIILIFLFNLKISFNFLLLFIFTIFQIFILLFVPVFGDVAKKTVKAPLVTFPFGTIKSLLHRFKL